jgi:hypothetical protein
MVLSQRYVVNPGKVPTLKLNAQTRQQKKKILPRTQGSHTKLCVTSSSGVVAGDGKVIKSLLFKKFNQNMGEFQLAKAKEKGKCTISDEVLMKIYRQHVEKKNHVEKKKKEVKSE